MRPQECALAFALAGLPARRARSRGTTLTMPKSGIKIVSEKPGSGPELKKGERVRVRYDIRFNRGDFLARNQETVFTVGDRELVAGFRYGLEGIRAGGTRSFKASPHLCYRDAALASIPKNAVLIFDIKHVEIVP
jgi:FKBP-type peptidyl-prolyl cis-trans isomerase